MHTPQNAPPKKSSAPLPLLLAPLPTRPLAHRTFIHGALGRPTPASRILTVSADVLMLRWGSVNHLHQGLVPSFGAGPSGLALLCSRRHLCLSLYHNTVPSRSGTGRLRCQLRTFKPSSVRNVFDAEAAREHSPERRPQCSSHSPTVGTQELGVPQSCLYRSPNRGV